MGITVTTSDQQITASVGETKIDVTVSGGIGPAGPAGAAGASSWNDITGKPSTFTPATHTHAGSDVSYAPLGVATSAATVQLALEDIENAIETRVGSGQYATTNDFGIVKVGGGISVSDGVISVSTNYAAASHTHTLSAITDAGTAAGKNVPTTGNASSTQVVLGSDTRLTDDRYPTAHNASHWPDGDDPLYPGDIGAAAVSHAHSATADLTFSGATAGQVLTVNSGATALVWATPTTYSLPDATNSVKGGVIVGSGLSVSSGTISVITYAVRSDTVSSTSYIGRAVSGSATSASVWTIRRTVLTSAGAVSATTTATNVKWDDRLTASYS